MNISKSQIKNMLDDKCLYKFGCKLNEASEQQIYKTTCLVVKDLLTNKSNEFDKLVKKQKGKQVYYMSMEFLVGTSLQNNLYNLNLEDDFKKVLADINIDIEDLYKIEPDAGLGNGGLGRLASCYMDSLTTLSMKSTGYSLRYEFGIFKQKIIDGWQMEFPDNWLDLGDVWLKSREDTSFEIKFGGEVVHGEENGRYKPRHINYDTVIAVPYDMYITGYDTNAVNKLVLWSAKSPKNIDMNLFSRGDYAKALEENTMAEAITKVLYPADDHIEGKRLRLKQQYVLVSASIQNILKDHMEQYNDIQLLPEKVAIHINDTHPALCVPELMRILLDDYNLDWDNAFDICNRTLFYTNHTVMSEALEKWPEFLFKQELPRVYTIVCEINRRFVNQIREIYPNDFAKIDYMSIISNNEVKMANLCLACVNKVNGVSTLIVENAIDLALERDVPDILCSALVQDCIGRGKTIKEGGAIYDFISGLQVGIANMADSLAAIKKLVFEEKKITPEQLCNALEDDFTSEENQKIQQMLINDVPKYGNDDDYVDNLVVEVYNVYIDEMKKYPNTRYNRGPIGGIRYAGTSSISANVGQGFSTMATPDGRKAHSPLAEGCSPAHSMDKNGPTAVFKSVSKLPTHEITGGVLLNQKVTPQLLASDENKEKLEMLIKTFFNRLDGYHVQYNVVSRETLIDAQKHPEKHKDLIVRVAGYSAFFNVLSKATQDDIIERTEQTL